MAVSPAGVYPEKMYNPKDLKEIKKDYHAVAQKALEYINKNEGHDFYTVQMVKSIKIDKAFLSHAGLTVAFGASIHNSAGVEFGKAVMQNSTVNIGLYPSEKVGKNSIHSVCSISDYDFIITDDNISEDFKLQMGELGIKLEIAKVKGR